jgi:signal transduction histidine kinase
MKLWPRDPSAAKPFVEQAQCLAVTAMREVRRSVSTLRTDARKELPLQEAIESLVNDFRQGTGVSTSTRVNVQLPIPPQVVTVFYRVVQEALTNICKHAQATEVTVEVETMPEQIHLVITDNGQGFNPEQTNGGFGLCGMQERVAALSGSFYLHTAPGTGCQIRIEIPLQKRVAPELEQMPQFGGRDRGSPLPHLRTYARNG